MSTAIALATTTGRVLVVPPSVVPEGAEWAVIRLDHTPEHHLTIEFERTTDGQAWESAGSVTFGDDHTRDYTFPLHYRVRASISADGYTYRAYVDSGAEEVTYQGDFDFEGSRAAVALGAGVEIAGYERLEIGSAAHYNLIQNCTLPPLSGLTGENCAVAVIIARHNNTPIGGELGWGVGNPDYGDHEVVRWGGSSGDDLDRALFSENLVSASVCGYCASGVSPDDDPRVYAQWTTPPEWYLTRPNPFNNLTPHVTVAAIALKHVRQSDPIRGLWRACTQPAGSMLGCGASTAIDSVGGNVPTSPGDVVIGAASLIVVEHDPSADIAAGGTDLSHHVWGHATTGPGADSWVGVIDAKEAGVGAQTSMLYAATFDIANQTNFTGAAIAFAQTEYVHHVAILTPEDLGDLPDADQVRAGTDGFDAPALDHQQRGPDASGRVTFDPFSGEIPEQTDISLGFVYEGEDAVAWAHITTAQAIYYVAVETPEDPEDLPTSAQIKGGTDGDGSPALDYQARTLAPGTVTFAPTTGAESGKSYTLAFVTGDELPVFAEGAAVASIGQSAPTPIEALFCVSRGSSAVIEASADVSASEAAPVEQLAPAGAQKAAAVESSDIAARHGSASLESGLRLAADETGLVEALRGVSQTGAGAIEAGGAAVVSREDTAALEALGRVAPVLPAALEHLAAAGQVSVVSVEALGPVAAAAVAALELVQGCRRTAAAAYESSGDAAISASGPICVEALRALDTVVQASAEGVASCSVADLAALEALGSIRRALAAAIESGGAPALSAHAIELLLDAEHALLLLLDNPRP